MAVDKLLRPGEVLVIVDDDPAIRQPLKIYLEHQGLTILEAGSAAELYRLLAGGSVALVLLDIGLPDADGIAMLPDLVSRHPDLGVVMLTGVADVHVAMECIRKGAADYLSKPVQFDEILFVVRRVLERRRLIFENYQYQTDLEKAHFRIQIFHQLSLKMNTAYLSTVALDEILQAVLVGITAEEGLRFNRAFLVLFNEDGTVLEGRMAIGSDCRERAGQVWHELQEKKLDFMDIVHNLKVSCLNGDLRVNEMVRQLRVPIEDCEHLLIKAALDRRSILVTDGRAEVPVPPQLFALLDEDSFVVVPLYSPGRSLGVIIADHFVTRRPITRDHVNSLELFASQASLAIEHSHLYMGMQKKIGELEAMTQEVEKSKDLLVEAERYSALGQMAAQLVHALRNPITSIGGVARLLARRVKDEEWLRFLNMMIRETVRVETTLEDLFDFVGEGVSQKEITSLYPLIRKTIMLVQTSLERQHIVYHLDLPEPDPILEADIKQIRQALLHLVKNAMEAMPDGGNLTIAARQADGWVQVSISDTGQGIQTPHIERATDPFFTTKTYGTGLGLTLVERIAKVHGGLFSLKSHEGEGTEVILQLPLVPFG